MLAVSGRPHPTPARTAGLKPPCRAAVSGRPHPTPARTAGLEPPCRAAVSGRPHPTPAGTAKLEPPCRAAVSGRPHPTPARTAGLEPPCCAAVSRSPPYPTPDAQPDPRRPTALPTACTCADAAPACQALPLAARRRADEGDALVGDILGVECGDALFADAPLADERQPLLPSAWHGLTCTVSGTSRTRLGDWPSGGGRFDATSSSSCSLIARFGSCGGRHDRRARSGRAARPQGEVRAGGTTAGRGQGGRHDHRARSGRIEAHGEGPAPATHGEGPAVSHT
eukprot:351628-Chlamydomonas_euryale.AAC.12